MSSHSLVIAIPDIHGEFGQLTKVLSHIEKKYSDYKLVFTGDYIDRGPQSNKVLKLVKEKTENGHIALMGNHEQFLIEWLYDGGDWYMQPNFGGMATIKSYESELGMTLDNNSLKEHLGNSGILQWVAHLPTHHIEGNLVFTHAPVTKEYWFNSEPYSEAAKHLMPKKGELEAIWSPDGMFAVCGHIPVDKPTIFENGMYLDCGCGSGTKLLHAAVFKNGQLEKYITPYGFISK